MIELFPDVPERIKQQAKFIADLAFQKTNPAQIVTILNEYTSSCYSKEERDFCEFYFNLRMEQVLNEG